MLPTPPEGLPVVRVVAGVKRTLSVDLGAGLVPADARDGRRGLRRGPAASSPDSWISTRWAAWCRRTITVEPQRGSPTPRIAESPAGVVWSTGLQNPGVDAFVAEELPRLARGGAHVVVSIAGTSLEEFVRLTSMLQSRPEVAAIEVYLAGAGRRAGARAELGVHVDRAVEVVGAVARMSLVPTFAKLPIHAPDVGELARAVVRAGAHGVTVGGRRRRWA